VSATVGTVALAPVEHPVPAQRVGVVLDLHRCGLGGAQGVIPSR
jgi:hypothetical protein